MARLLHLTLCIVGIVLGLLVANRPRFWWQELFHNAALYWSIPAFFAAFLLIRGMLRRRAWSWVAVVAVLAYVYAITQMGYRVRRYIHFAGWKPVVATAPVISGLWVDTFSPHTEQEFVKELVSRFNPTLLIISARGSGPQAAPQIAGAYPYRIATSASPDGVIEILSRLRPLANEMTQLGFDALPGGVVSLAMPDEGEFELGVLMLERSHDKASFERNRISSRRLSSLMRNSQQRRIVVGNLNTTPFSMLSSIFNEQSGMRSLVFQSGFVNTLGVLSLNSHVFGRNVFVSRDMVRKDFEFVDLPGRNEPVVFFSVLVRMSESDSQLGNAMATDYNAEY